MRELITTDEIKAFFKNERRWFPRDEFYRKPPAIDGEWKLLLEDEQRNHAGLLEGTHTGGAWYNEITGEVWKPLFGGGPVGNLCPTDEAIILVEQSGTPFFPWNWNVIVLERGDPWLIRPKVHPIHPKELSLKQLWELENRLRKLNSDGWEVNDVITLAVDFDEYKPMILDLSIAQRQDPRWASDSGAMHDVWAASNFGRITELRSAARKNISQFEMIDPIMAKWGVDSGDAIDIAFNMHYIYGSTSRPLSMMWMKEPDCERYLLLDGHYPSHSWLITSDLLPKEYCKSYELTLAYATWPYAILPERTIMYA